MKENIIVQNSRLLSLDVFRGLTVAAMILVNNPGDWGNIYAPLEHAEWNGCTPTDLIFPFFLFIVGVSIAFSLGSKKENNVPGNQIIRSVIKRSAILFALGIILALFPDIFIEPVNALASVRIPGVLQRIAIVYLVCAILFYKTTVKTQLSIFLFLLIIYWALLNLVPVPGGVAPNMGKETSLAAWLDRTLLSEAHLWKLSRTWDPEGILSTLPAIATGISGTLAGIWLRKNDLKPQNTVLCMILAGIIFIVTGLLWNISFPINKALWTSSYVFFTSGLAAILLAALYWFIDIKSYKSFTGPFEVYGVNAITVFFMSTIIAKLFNFITINTSEDQSVSVKSWLYQSYFTPYFSPLNASLFWALAFVLFWLVILWWMYRQRIILKV